MENVAKELFNFYKSHSQQNIIKVRGFMVSSGKLNINQVSSMIDEINDPVALVVSINADNELKKLNTLQDFRDFVDEYPIEQKIQSTINQLNSFEFDIVRVANKASLIIDQLNEMNDESESESNERKICIIV